MAHVRALSLAVGGVAIVLGACGPKSAPPSTVPPTATPVVVEADGDAPPVAEAKDEPAHDDAETSDAPAIAVDDKKIEEPNPYVAPLVRTEGNLTVHAPPQTPSRNFVGRLRTHVEGGLGKRAQRTWVGPQVPGFVSLMEGTAELFVLDRVHDDFMALYRDPYGASSCDLSGDANCNFFVRLYDIFGEEQWTVALHEHFSRPDKLEVQDVRYDGGLLFFNEACQSYSKDAGGKCSSLVAYDPQAKAVAWRTRSLVSNGQFLPIGDYIVTGYGFTAEPDFIYVVSRADGSIKHKVRVPKSAETFHIVEDGRLGVSIYSSQPRHYRMTGWDTKRPKLVRDER